MSLPLSGITVLDLSRLLPGPVCTLHLADLGADVIKIEDLNEGDYARGMGELRGSGRDAMSDFFVLVNRNKRAAGLDLKRADGVAAFKRLAARADVIVESFRPGVMEKLGLGYETLRALNPALVMCAISGYGQTGPWAHLAGHDINYLSINGVLEQTGPAQAPALSNLQIADLLGGAMTPAFAIMAALFDAKRSGQGRMVDVSMTDAVLSHAVMPLLSGTRGAARGNDQLSGGIAAYNIYTTSDGKHMAVGSLEPKFWAKTCEVLSLPHLTKKGWLTGSAGATVKAEVAACFLKRTRDEWADIFEAADCCVTPVLTPSEAQQHPQLKAREMFQTHTHPTYGEHVALNLPFKLSGLDNTAARPAPARGEHTRAVLAEAGMTEAEIGALIGTGAAG
jgi:alpha-methylacyl-CoA racemase